MDQIPITIDFETAYSSAYSLTKMTTAEYILHPQFEIIGVAVKLGDAVTQWFTGTHDEVKAWLAQFPFEQPGYVTVIQNTHFDGAILEWILDIHPAKYFCTRMAARPLLVPFTKSAKLATLAAHLGIGIKGGDAIDNIGKWRRDFTAAELARYGVYCCNDVELTLKLYEAMEPHLPPDEQDLIHYTTLKFTRPQVWLDDNVVLARLATVRAEKANVLRKVGMLTNEDLMSNDKFAKALEAVGVEPPRKLSPSTGKETWAFSKADPEFTDLLEHDDVTVQALVAARLKHRSTQEETRLERFHKQAMLNRPFALPVLYYGAHTGRFSGLDKLNLQNLPRGGALREALLAPPGYKLVAGDLSQIEARTTAYLASADQLVERFREGEDVYRWFAAEKLYRKPPEEVSKEERFVAKTCILGMGYGVGASKFHLVMRNAGINMTFQEAERTVNAYRRSFSEIPKLWALLGTALDYLADAKAMNMRYPRIPVIFGTEFIQLPSGMQLLYPGIHKDPMEGNYAYESHRGVRRLWGGALLENIVQALTRIILTDAELYLARRGYPALLSVHDELVYLIREEAVEKFKVVLERVLTRPVSWMPGLPIACEVKHGNNYAECK